LKSHMDIDESLIAGLMPILGSWEDSEQRKSGYADFLRYLHEQLDTPARLWVLNVETGRFEGTDGGGGLFTTIVDQFAVMVESANPFGIVRGGWLINEREFKSGLAIVSGHYLTGILLCEIDLELCPSEVLIRLAASWLGGLLRAEQAERRRSIEELDHLTELLVREEATRNRIFDDIHDLLATPLAMVVQRAYQRKADWLVEVLEPILKDLRLVLSDLEHGVTLRRPLRLEIQGLVDTAHLMAQQAEAHIELNRDHEIRLELEPAFHVYCIIAEAMHNAHKAMPSCHVEIEVRVIQDDRLLVVVRDNGPGISYSLDGRGMRMMHRRAVELEGGLDVTWQRGVGSEVRLVIPGRVMFRRKTARS